MLNETRVQVNEVIKNKWFVETREKRWTGSPQMYEVLRIDDDDSIIVTKFDTIDTSEIKLTEKDWQKLVDKEGNGIFESFGIYSFSPAKDPANTLIKQCAANPEFYGKELYAARLRIKELEQLLEIHSKTNIF